MRSWLFIPALAMCSVSIVTCGGKVVVDRSGAGGGGASSSGTGGAVTTSTNQGAGGPTTTTSVTTTTSTGPTSCVGCAEVITSPGVDPGQLCPNSFAIFEALQQCACQTECQDACGSNACQGQQGSKSCGNCVQTKCQSQFDTCANDV